MPLVARRKLSETWRQALASRLDGIEAAEKVLSAFDERVRTGASEAEAAYRVLEDCGRLWTVDEPAAPPSAVTE